MGGIGAYLRYKANEHDFEKVELTEEELFQLFVKSGKSPEDAKFHIELCKKLGSSVVVGKFSVKLKKGKANE